MQMNEIIAFAFGVSMVPTPLLPSDDAMSAPTMNSQITSCVPPWISRNLRPNLRQQQQHSNVTMPLMM
jgi:hypothetical protein